MHAHVCYRNACVCRGGRGGCRRSRLIRGAHARWLGLLSAPQDGQQQQPVRPAAVALQLSRSLISTITTHLCDDSHHARLLAAVRDLKHGLVHVGVKLLSLRVKLLHAVLLEHLAEEGTLQSEGSRCMLGQILKHLAVWGVKARHSDTQLLSPL